MDHWLSLSLLETVLFGAALVVLGAVAGRYAGRRRGREVREDAGREAATQDTGIRPSQTAGCEEAAGRAEQMALHEFDGGPPRPNWNRQKNLNVMG